MACAGKDYETVPTSQRVVALTVDAGGDDAGLARILDVLATQHVRATFFVTGRWAQRYPDGVRAIAAAGHLIGNHTTTHPHLPQLSDTAIRAELQTADQTVAALTGRTTKPLFRFPFGDRDARSLAVVNGAGYCAVRWTVDTLGWKGTSGGSSTQSVVARVLAGLRPGEVVLLHAGANPDDGTTLDADALPSVIAEIRSRGYGFTTLAGFSS